MKRGILVAFEGVDGAGKTTQVRQLERALDRAGIPYLSTKEPTNRPWGQKIRASARTGRMSPTDELNAFLEDRREHVEQEIAPALAAGKVVIIDRYYPSTVAYQGARGLDPAELLAANAFAPAPDVLIVLDVDPALGLERVHGRGEGADLFEKEDELRRAAAIFRQLGPAHGVDNVHLLDATRPPDELADEIADLVERAHRGRRDR